MKVKCTQYGICSQVAFKNARAMCFLKLGKAGNNFWVRFKDVFGGLPNLDPTPPKVREGVFMSAMLSIQPKVVVVFFLK